MPAADTVGKEIHLQKERYFRRAALGTGEDLEVSIPAVRKPYLNIEEKPDSPD